VLAHGGRRAKQVRRGRRVQALELGWRGGLLYAGE
jgi:hypothetical protein